MIFLIHFYESFVKINILFNFKTILWFFTYYMILQKNLFINFLKVLSFLSFKNYAKHSPVSNHFDCEDHDISDFSFFIYTILT